MTFLVATIAALLTAEPPDILLANFEARSYGTWKTQGEAFGNEPATGTLPNQMPVSGYRGKGLANSYHGGDDTTGKLTSPDFTIERRYLRFLVGGGGWPGATCINLVSQNQIVRTATGTNQQSGGTEELQPVHWDVADLLGKIARIEIVDQAKGGWGHICVDHIVATNQEPPPGPGPATREILFDRNILLLPIKNNGPKRKLQFTSDAGPSLSLDIELADDEPDWWAFLPTRPWQGKKVKIDVDRVPADSKGLANIRPADDLPDRSQIYNESKRPQFHFSSQRGWNNDPNGLSFYRGEYHLFYQHNPVGWNWGNMHWGHAVSKDLVHWTELGDALWPDQQGAMFSGSAIVDVHNTSGLGTKQSPPHILLYTAWGSPRQPDVQSLAYSLDGRTYTKYVGNPVVPQITTGNRDPKIIWHDPSRQWVMALYVEQPKGKHTIQFLTSSDLKSWTKTSQIEGFFECPDLFPLPLEGNPEQTKWILTAADSTYMIGSFDGKTFHSETAKLPGHRGRGFYAAQTFSDIPSSDGRRIQIGWLQAPSPDMPFNQAMSLPLELRLVPTGDGPRLSWNPVKELESLRVSSESIPPTTIHPDTPNPFAAWAPDLYELDLRFRNDNAKQVSLELRGAKLMIDFTTNEVALLDHRVTLDHPSKDYSLRVFADRTSIEIFLSNGQHYLPIPFIADPTHRQLKIAVDGGSIQLTAATLHALSSAWPATTSGPKTDQ
jgi:sucrose-6-phosphate hydrolase SacC (GH32 family)